ncbi:ABC transporter substrate-binding protein [Pelomicrobium sp.]|jgi:ABC-type nitrate/sulfonate/bicarbonate transport system substrate-binding protein|uniref:ABC transporter substrate-binding protein n=1 Tax=Pelomicrobium sp. TaxID=2815319 RepID=UPI002FDEF54A
MEKRTLGRFTLGVALGIGLLFKQAAMGAEPVHITYGYHPYWTGAWYGVILKAQELWKKHLPPGSTVKFEPHLTGPPMVNAMLANKMQIGTMGDMPSLVATTKKDIADLRLVSVTMFSKGQHCEKILVHKGAPEFKDYKEAMQWLNGKPFAYHKGTCANRITESIIAKGGFKPSKILIMPIEVIASNFEAGKLTAAAMWEPHARRVVENGHARYAATSAPWEEYDANFTSMRQDFIEKHPEAAIGWLKAEIEALQFMLANPRETIRIIAKELTGYDEKTVWASLYEGLPANIGGNPVNYVAKLTFDEEVLDLMSKGYKFLHEIKVIPSPQMPPNAINDAPLKKAMQELGAKAPLGEIRGQPREAFAKLMAGN